MGNIIRILGLVFWMHNKEILFAGLIYWAEQGKKAAHDTKSISWRGSALAGRAGFGQLLCALQGGEKMVVGNVLAGGGVLLVDHMPVAFRLFHDERFVRSAQAAELQHAGVDLLLRPARSEEHTSELQ